MDEDRRVDLEKGQSSNHPQHVPSSSTAWVANLQVGLEKENNLHTKVAAGLGIHIHVEDDTAFLEEEQAAC